MRFRLPRFLHRLDVRFGIAIVLLILPPALFGDRVIDLFAGGRGLGIDSPERWVPAQMWGDRLMCRAPASDDWVFQPKAEDREYVQRELGEAGIEYVLLTRRGNVLLSSPKLDLPVGKPCPLPVETTIKHGGVEYSVLAAPVTRFNVLAATFVVLRPPGAQIPFPMPPDLSFLPGHGETPGPWHGRNVTTAMHVHFEAWVEASAWVGVASLVAIVLGLAVLVSWWVARPLRRLVRATRSRGSLPGPFVVRGNDEIAELARALNAMRERIVELLSEAETRDSKRRELLAGISHDLRTPLTSLRLCLERAQRSEDASQIDEILGVARHDAERVELFARDLVELAKLELDEGIVAETLYPQELVSQALRSVRPLAHESGIELESRYAPDVGPVEVDGHLMLRAFENVLRNAIRHADTRVQVVVDATSEGIRFEIHDDGPGFPGGPGQVDPASLDTPPTGLGLGLKIAQRILEAHGSTIEARNGERETVVGWSLHDSVCQVQKPLNVAS